MPDVTKKLDATQAMGWFVDTLRSLGVIEPEEGSQEALLHSLRAETKDELKTAANADPAFKTGFEALVGEPIDTFLKDVLTVANVAKRIIDATSSEGTKGVSRFADKAPGTAVATVDKDAQEGLGIEVGGEEFKPDVEAVALMPDQHLFKGQLPKRRPRNMNETMATARANLETAVAELKAKRRSGISHDILDKMLPIFDGVVSGSLGLPLFSDELGSDVAKRLVNILARHPVEARLWVEAVVSANYERGLDQGSFIIPEAKSHESIYEKEHIPEEGTTVQMSAPDSFKRARDKYTILTAFMTEYKETLGELARLKPGLFGEKALERLNRRYLAIQEIYATLDAEERKQLFKDAKDANVLPYAWPTALEEDDHTIAILKEVEALEEWLGRDALDERVQKWKNGKPPAGAVEELDLGVKENGWMNEDGIPRLETGDGVLLEDLQAELDPWQRLLDLHSAALARDIDVIVTAMRVVGAKPKEQWQAGLNDMPDLKEMEKMWRPSKKGMEAPDRANLLSRAGLLPNSETPLLALPASIENRYVKGNANLLTAGKVDGAIRSAEGAAMMANVEGGTSTALTVVQKHSNKGDTLLQLGALMHELNKAALEGNEAGAGRAIRGLEDLMKRKRGALLAEFATGRGRMAEVFGKNFGAEAKARLVKVAGRNAPGGAEEGKRPDRNPLESGKR